MRGEEVKVLLISLLTCIEWLLRIRHYSQYVPCTNPSHLAPEPYEEGTCIIPILQRKKLSHRKVIAQGSAQCLYDRSHSSTNILQDTRRMWDVQCSPNVLAVTSASTGVDAGTRMK